MANSATDLGVRHGQRISLDTTGLWTMPLNPMTYPFRLGSWILHVVVGGATPGSFIPKLRAASSALTGANQISTIYFKASTDTSVAAGTPIQTNDIYIVPSDMCDLILDYTSGADGMVIYAWPYIG